MGRKLARAKARQGKCQDGGGQQAGVSMKARKEAMGRQCTADGWRCREGGGRFCHFLDLHAVFLTLHIYFVSCHFYT